MLIVAVTGASVVLVLEMHASTVMPAWIPECSGAGL